MMPLMKWLLCPYFLIIPIITYAQQPEIISGPFLGNATTSSVEFWMMGKHFDAVTVLIEDGGEVELRTAVIQDSIILVKGQIIGIENKSVGTIQISKGTISHNEKFSIRLAPRKISDFSFLAGSCTWPYSSTNKKWGIFDTMKNLTSDFMIWMGDNIYLLKGDWNDEERVNARYISYRGQKQLNAFLKSQVNYSAWDDHDFGPNNAMGDFENKEVTLNAFRQFWINPDYGSDSLPGTFYTFQWQDAAFYVLDGRYYKSDESLYGKEQLDWLKAHILDSDARIKFIIGGCQFLPESSGEDWGDHPDEKADFLSFLKMNKIRGVVFLSGDRHLAELSILDDGSHPKIIEITSSPLTSFVNPGFFYKNPLRKKGTLVTKRNFAHISLLGEGSDRKLKVSLMGRKSQVFWNYEINLDELE